MGLNNLFKILELYKNKRINSLYRHFNERFDKIVNNVANL